MALVSVVNAELLSVDDSLETLLPVELLSLADDIEEVMLGSVVVVMSYDELGDSVELLP